MFSVRPCTTLRALLPLALVSMTLLVLPALGQYSTTEVSNTKTFPADSALQYYGYPMATDGIYAVFSTGNALWSMPASGGTPMKVFSIPADLPGSSVAASYIYGAVAVDQGVIVFEANGAGSSTLYGLYSVRADGSGTAARIADSTQITNWNTNSAWFYGNYGLYSVAGDKVVFNNSNSLFSASIDGSGLTPLWQTVSGGFQGCPPNALFPLGNAKYPATDGTNYAFTGSNVFGTVSDTLFAAPLTDVDTCEEFPFGSLPGQPQAGQGVNIALGIQLDEGNVYFAADAPQGISASQDYRGIFKFPVAGGAATAVVTNLSHLPGLANPDGTYPDLYFGGFAVSHGRVVFLASPSTSGIQVFYLVKGTGYAPLFWTSSSEDDVCVSGLEEFDSGGLNGPALSPDGILVFPAGTEPETSGYCSGFFGTQAYYALDTNKPLSLGIDYLTPDAAPVGTSVEIVGQGFGATQGNSSVEFNGVAATVTSWSDTAIAALVPSGLGIYANVAVLVDGATSNGLNLNIVPATGTVLTSSPNPSEFGQAVTFTATVKTTSGPASGGIVTFKHGGTVIGTGMLSSGVATLMYSGLAVGSHSIIATYSGGSGGGTSTSNAVLQVVNPAVAATTTTLDSSPNPSILGQSVTFTATVTASSGPTPTGTVTFKHGGTVIGTGTLSGGVATLVYSGLTVGSHSITATYGGSATDATSTSAALSQVVNAPLITTTTNLTSSPNPSALGQSVTFTATVTAASGPKPTGTVTFKHGGTVIGTGTLSGGVATLVYSGLPQGNHSITASYNGSSTDAVSTSTALLQVVQSATAPAAIKLNFGNNQRTVVGADFPQLLEVLVTDQFGQPVVGVNVVFKGAGLVVSATVATTNGNGIAAVGAAAVTVGTEAAAAEVQGNKNLRVIFTETGTK